MLHKQHTTAASYSQTKVRHYILSTERVKSTTRYYLPITFILYKTDPLL